MDQKGKVAIITGASRGMGKQMALRLAKRGVNVVLAARTVSANESEWPGSLTETANEIRALGSRRGPGQMRSDRYARMSRTCAKPRWISTAAWTSCSTTRATLGEGHFDPFLNISFDLWDKYLWPPT